MPGLCQKCVNHYLLFTIYAECVVDCIVRQRCAASISAAPGSAVLFAVDAALASPPADWRSQSQQTGSWWLEQTQPLPAEVERFLAAGPPPNYIGFGCMPIRDPAARLRVIVDGVTASGCRALISAGWAGLGKQDGPAQGEVS